MFCATISMVSRANIQHFLQVEKGRCRILMAFSISHCSNENGQRQDFLKFILLIFEKQNFEFAVFSYICGNARSRKNEYQRKIVRVTISLC